MRPQKLGYLREWWRDIISFHVIFLVCGFNPSEKYESNWESSPNRDENKTCLKPPPSISISKIGIPKNWHVFFWKKMGCKAVSFREYYGLLSIDNLIPCLKNMRKCLTYYMHKIYKSQSKVKWWMKPGSQRLNKQSRFLGTKNPCLEKTKKSLPSPELTVRTWKWAIPEGKDRIPTIHFQVLLLLVFREGTSPHSALTTWKFTPTPHRGPSAWHWNLKLPLIPWLHLIFPETSLASEFTPLKNGWLREDPAKPFGVIDCLFSGAKMLVLGRVLLVDFSTSPIVEVGSWESCCTWKWFMIVFVDLFEPTPRFQIANQRFAKFLVLKKRSSPSWCSPLGFYVWVYTNDKLMGYVEHATWSTSTY